MSSRKIFLFLFLALFIEIFSEINYNKESLRIHENNKGKLSVNSKVPVLDKEDLSIVSSPWVSEHVIKYTMINQMFINTQ